MDTAIQLYNQFARRAVEIQDKWGNWVLGAELQARQFPTP